MQLEYIIEGAAADRTGGEVAGMILDRPVYNHLTLKSNMNGSNMQSLKQFFVFV